jgi:hypothetical protein
MFVPLAPAAQNLGVGLRRPCRVQVFGGVLGAMLRIALPQPHEVMARIASRFLVPQPNGKQQNFACPQLLFDEYLELVFFSGSLRPSSHQSPKTTILRSAQQRFLLDPPCSAAAFKVNSEPHTGARPSVRLCVGLINLRPHLACNS